MPPWNGMYLLKNLHRLQEIPVRLQEKIFNKVFEQAEIAKLTKEEKSVAIAREMKKDGHPIEMISRYTSLTKEQIEKL